MDEGNDFRGYDLWMEGGKVGLHVINKWPSNAKVISKSKAPIKNGPNYLLLTMEMEKKAWKFTSMVKNRKSHSAEFT